MESLAAVGIHRSRKNRSHTLSCFRTCRRTRVCFEKPWKIFAALPSAERHMCLVLALQARQGPNTQDQAGRLKAATGHLLRGRDGQLSSTWYCWQGGWQIIQHPVGLPTALEAGEESHQRDLSSVFMTVGDADTLSRASQFSAGRGYVSRSP